MLHESACELLLDLIVTETLNSYIGGFLLGQHLVHSDGACVIIGLFDHSLFLPLILFVHHCLKLPLLFLLNQLRPHPVEVLLAFEVILLPMKQLIALVLLKTVHQARYFLVAYWALRLWLVCLRISLW